MLVLRIKQAECALADGRLDEAFELVRAEDVRQHKRGQKLIGRLARAFAERGGNHLAAHRLQQALTDCNKADKLGGNLPETAELRAAICRAIEQKQRGRQRRSQKLARAKEHMDNGWLSAGEQLLADAAGDDNEADILLQQAAARRLQMEAAMAGAGQALQRGDLEAAIDIVTKAGITDAHNPKAAELSTRIKSLSRQRIIEDLGKGRLDLADCLLERLKPLAAGSADIKEMELAVSHCRQAARFMSAGQPRRAAQILRKVTTILPKAGWLDTAISQAEKAAEAMDALCAGPLGLGVCDSGPTGEYGTAVEQEHTPSFEKDDNNRGSALPKAASGARTPLQLPSRFILQVDGVGSFLVLRGQSVTVGPISSSVRPALGLLADPHLPVATIERSDEDYFVRSQKPIYVNDRPVTEKLLDNGDHIALSARCRMKFSVPNVASTTATLTLSSGRLPRPDISHIILMDRDILMGPGFNNHVSTDRLLDNVTLLVQNGYLLCRAKERPIAAGRPLDLRAGLPMNTPIKIGRISLVLAKLEE